MKKQLVIEMLSQLHARLLFQTLVPLHGTKEECYGTSSDVYLENVTVDIDIDETVISLIFSTHNKPCIPFCMKLANRLNLNVQLLYFNQEDDYSGKFSIHWYQVVINVQHSYWYGMYKYQEQLFWESIPDIFQPGIEFHWFVGSCGLTQMRFDDISRLKNMFEESNLASLFEKL